jgi:signal transduction histidine kinase
VRLTGRLPPGTELALYRIFQEALSNVEKHARARHVVVCLRRQRALVELVIKDDGIGFDLDHPLIRASRAGLGLLSMRERAAYVGGILKVKSLRRAGTEIEVRIPLSRYSRGASRGFTGSAAFQKA